jgi:hypothetical protein
MEGSPLGSPIKVHFSSTQFVGGMQYIPLAQVQPFEPYRLVTKEGKWLLGY